MFDISDTKERAPVTRETIFLTHITHLSSATRPRSVRLPITSDSRGWHRHYRFAYNHCCVTDVIASNYFDRSSTGEEKWSCYTVESARNEEHERSMDGPSIERSDGYLRNGDRLALVAWPCATYLKQKANETPIKISSRRGTSVPKRTHARARTADRGNYPRGPSLPRFVFLTNCCDGN